MHSPRYDTQIQGSKGSFLIDQDSINSIATVWVLVYCHPQVIKTSVLQVCKKNYFKIYFCLYFKNILSLVFLVTRAIQN